MRSLLVTGYYVGMSLTLVVLLLPEVGTMALPLAGLGSELTLSLLLLRWLSIGSELNIRELVPTLFFIALAVAAPTPLVLFLSPELSIALVAPVSASLAAFAHRFLLAPSERDLLRDALRRGRANLARRGS